MFGLSEGFDIVIGNPPYVQLQKATGEIGIDKKGKPYDIKVGDVYEDKQFESFAKTGDIYCLFYEQGNKLVKDGGQVCYITSNKWMRAGYGEKLRNYFIKRTNPKILIDFGGIQVFESATVDTNILLFAKEKNVGKTLSVSIGKDKLIGFINLSDFVRQNASEVGFSTSDSWVILSPIEQSIKRKIEVVGVPLKDWDINIYRGVLTGYNEAFIISTEKRNEILANCATEEERKRTEELIRPILRGRDIKRYGYDWAGWYLIATFPSRHYDIEEYTAVKDYLLSFGIERLEQTGREYRVNGQKFKARKKTNNKWFETQDSISYWDDFSKPKIAWPSVGATEYSLIPEGFMLLDTNYFLTCSNPYNLLAFLNSALIVWWINSEDTQLGTGGAWRHYKYNLEKLNIPYNHRDFDKVINKILSSHNYNDKESIDFINKKVFEIYNLDNDEIKFIQSQHIQ